MLLIIFCVNTLKNGRVILIGGKQSKVIKKNIFFYCVCIKWFLKLQKKDEENVVLKQ